MHDEGVQLASLLDEYNTWPYHTKKSWYVQLWIYYSTVC
jgi:hypothetical protein